MCRIFTQVEKGTPSSSSAFHYRLPTTPMPHVMGMRGFLSASVCEHEHRKQFEVSVGGQWRVEVSVDGQSNTSRLLLCGGR